jgi:exonuclease VII large subunit
MKKILLLLYLLFSTLVKAQTPTVALTDIRNYVGKTVTVCEKVKSTFKTREHEHSFLNFGDVYPNQQLTVVIKKKHLKNFSYVPVTFLAGKTICVTGKVYLYKGKPQLRVKKENQVEIK